MVDETTGIIAARNSLRSDPGKTLDYKVGIKTGGNKYFVNI